MKLKDTAWKKSYDKPREWIKNQRHHFADKVPYSQSYGFSSSHVWMWELDCRECWVLKNWYFWTVLLKRTLESSLDSKEIKSVNPKGNKPWIFTGRTDAEAPILWPPDAKILLQRSSCKDPHWKRLWHWERLRVGGEGGNRGGEGWIALPTQWTWVWANSGRQWRTGKTVGLQSMGCKDSDTT